jgi:hypothetical protein
MVSDQILSWWNVNPESLIFDEKEGKISIKTSSD